MAEKNPGIKLNDIPLDLFLDYYGKYKGMQEERYLQKYENGYRVANVLKNGDILKIDPIYRDIYFSIDVPKSQISSLSTNADVHIDTLRKAYANIINTLPSIGDGNYQIFLVKDGFYLDGEIPEYSFYGKYVYKTTESWNSITNTGDNPIDYYFVNGNIQEDDKLKIPSYSNLYEFKKLFSLKDIPEIKMYPGDNENDLIQASKRKNTIFGKHYPYILKKYESRISSTTPHTIRFSEKIVQTDSSGREYIKLMINISNSEKYPDLTCFVNRKRKTLEFSINLSSALVTTSIKILNNSNDPNPNIGRFQKDENIGTITFTNGDDEFTLYGAYILNRDGSNTYTFTVPYDVEKYTMISKDLKTENSEDAENIVIGVANIGTIENIAKEVYRKLKPANPEPISSYYGIIKTGNPTTSYFKNSIQKEYITADTLSIYVPNTSETTSDIKNINDIVKKYGISTPIGYNQDSPGNAIFKKFNKKYKDRLRECLRQKIDFDAVSTDIESVYTLAKSLQKVILNETSTKTLPENKINSTVADDKIGIVSLNLSEYNDDLKIETDEKVFEIAESEKIPGKHVDNRNIFDRLLEADDYPTSRQYFQHLDDLANMNSGIPGEYVLENQPDEYVKQKAALEQKDVYKITPVYYKNAPLLDNAFTYYSENDQMSIKTPISLTSFLLSILQSTEDIPETYLIFMNDIYNRIMNSSLEPLVSNSENSYKKVLTAKSPVSEILEFASIMLHGKEKEDGQIIKYRIEGDVNE